MVRVMHGFHGVVNTESYVWLLFEPPIEIANEKEEMSTLLHWCFHAYARLCYFATTTSETSYDMPPGNTVQRSLLHDVSLQ